MKVTAVKCNHCNSIVYSRTRHDFRWCLCEKVAIDGGFDYIKVSASDDKYKMVEIDIDTTKEELYNDWNNRTDKYGIIK